MATHQGQIPQAIYGPLSVESVIQAERRRGFARLWALVASWLSVMVIVPFELAPFGLIGLPEQIYAQFIAVGLVTGLSIAFMMDGSNGIVAVPCTQWTCLLRAHPWIILGCCVSGMVCLGVWIFAGTTGIAIVCVAISVVGFGLVAPQAEGRTLSILHLGLMWTTFYTLLVILFGFPPDRLFLLAVIGLTLTGCMFPPAPQRIRIPFGIAAIACAVAAAWVDPSKTNVMHSAAIAFLFAGGLLGKSARASWL